MNLSLRPTKKILVRFVIFVGISIVVGSIIFVIWANSTYKADPEKLKTARDETINNITIIENSSYWEIIPKPTPEPCLNFCTTYLRTNSDSSGLIFYPGAKIDPRAYFYKLSDLSNGRVGKMRIFITKPTLNLAVFSINQADEIITANPNIAQWTIGGHSLGGAMSCEYAKNHTDKINSLYLISAYCANDISKTNIQVTSIHGSLDPMATPEKIQSYRRNLPNSAKDYEIQGMNHSQAGNYGKQDGDNEPTKADEEVKIEMMKIIST